MTIAIVTDSVSGITEEVGEKLDIHVVPLSVIFGSEVYKDNVDIKASEFYEKMRKFDKLPKTSQPTVGEMETFYEDFADQYDEIIGIHVSSKLSGTLDNAKIVADNLDAENVHLFDTETAAVPQRYFVIEAARLARKGASVQEILEHLEEMKKHTRMYILVNTLENFIKGGRLPGMKGGIATLLKIKPIVLVETGRVESIENIRTKTKAMRRLNEILEEEVADADYPIKVDIVHSDNLEEAELWQEELKAKYPHLNLNIFDMNPVVGVHVGEGALAFSVTRDYEKEEGERN